jgi:hypothetical protein
MGDTYRHQYLHVFRSGIDGAAIPGDDDLVYHWNLWMDLGYIHPTSQKIAACGRHEHSTV